MAAVLGRLHVVASDGTSLLHQTERADGVHVWEQIPVPGTYTEPAIAGFLGNLRLVAIVPGGRSLMYTELHADGTWSPPTQVAFTTDRGPTTATRVSIAQVGADLQVVALGGTGEVYHSILRSSGQWDPFRYVGSVAGEVGTVTAIAAAGSQDTLQVAVVNSAGGLYHTIRFANGSWQHYADVKPEIGDPGAVNEITIAGD